MFRKWLKDHSAADFDLTTELYPPACNREFWDSKYDHYYVAEAEKYLGYEWPMIRATQYMEIGKTGNRRAQETPHFARRTALCSLAMECHMGTYTDTAESIEELMNKVDSPRFRMYWQPNQFRTVEENIAHIKMTGKYAATLHAFNWIGDAKYPLADAVTEWREYLSYLDGEHTVLLEFLPDGRLESLAAEAEALRTIIE